MKLSLKKFFVIIFVNIIVFFGIFSILNYIFSNNINTCNFSNFIYRRIYFSKKLNNSINLKKYDFEDWRAEQIKFTKDSFNEFCGEQRIEFGENNNYTKSPIVILGCSYAYGHGLKKENSFPYLLSEYTKRPVYSFAGCGIEGVTSLKNLYQYISNSEDKKNKISNAKYFIYVYMYDHIDRYLQIDFLYANYEELFEINNKIYRKLIQYPLIKLTCSYWQLKKLIHPKNKSQIIDIENSSKFLKKVILYLNRQTKAISPDSEFIILLYSSKHFELYNPFKIMFDSEIENSKIWDEIEKETDIKIYRSEDLTGFIFNKDWCLKKDIAPTHPNEKAWKILTPLFAEKLN